MQKVGRPAKLDTDGNPIQKSLVNVTIPSKLAEFLKEKGVNRSKLFTDIVSEMYNDEICPKCYSRELVSGMVGTFCYKCSLNKGLRDSYQHWVSFNNCENCDKKYNPPYNVFRQSKDILKGCDCCILPKNRLDMELE